MLGNPYGHALRRKRSGKPLLSAGLLSSAFAIAFNFERSVYDSLYVALAVSSKAPLITADERLANTLAAHFPVKWLGSI
jgi:predicted nucleic acid-binding protein